MAVHAVGQAALETFDKGGQRAVLKNLIFMKQASVGVYDLLNELDRETASQDYIVSNEGRRDVGF